MATLHLDIRRAARVYHQMIWRPEQQIVGPRQAVEVGQVGCPVGAGHHGRLFHDSQPAGSAVDFDVSPIVTGGGGVVGERCLFGVLLLEARDYLASEERQEFEGQRDLALGQIDHEAGPLVRPLGRSLLVLGHLHARDAPTFSSLPDNPIFPLLAAR